jgi:hypothetical protein
MLFYYPVEAAAENWLHDCVIGMVTSSLEIMTAGGALATWPYCIPTAYRITLGNRTGLQERFQSLCEAARNLSSNERTEILDTITAENNFPAIFHGTAKCPRKSDLPATIRGPTTELFGFLFRLLTDFEIRDRHYKSIYQNTPAHVCPFCRIEPFDAPGIAREDLDHYLALSLYPFAGANLRNLAPMGHKCNASHKMAADILWDPVTGLRRRCTDPYSGPIVTVSLLGSSPFAGEIKDSIVLPKWEIDLQGSPEEIATWDNVFSIRARYKSSVLDEEFRGWLEHFAQWCKYEVGKIENSDGLVAALTRYLLVVIQEGFADRVFLKKAVFEMLKSHCVNMPVSERLTEWFMFLVNPME